MPARPKRPCRKQGCPNLTETGWCDNHRSEPAAQQKQRDRWRGDPASRGYDSDWRKVREQALRRDRYLCQHCLEAGRVRVACDVDHIIPIRIAPDLRLDLDNCRACCRPCHRLKTAADQRRYPQDSA